jgi:hypothetical protein
MLTMPARRLIAGTRSLLRWIAPGENPRSQIRNLRRRGTMFDAPITLALFAAFLLGIIAGSKLEILARARRY